MKKSMKKIWHIGFIDLKLMVTDKVFFFWVLVFPMIFILIFGNLFKTDRNLTKAALTVMNNDKGQWGAYFIEKIKAPGVELTVVEKEPKEYIRMLVIPNDFSQQIENKKAQELVLKKHSDTNLKAGQLAEIKIVQGIARIITELVLHGDKDIKTFFIQKPEFRNIVEIKSQFPENTIVKIPSGFDHVIPGILVQFVMMMVMIYGGVTVMEDRKRGVLSRILFSSVNFRELVSGKILGRLLMGLLQSFILIVAGILLFHLNLGNYVLVFLNILFFCAAMACLSIFIGSVLKSEDLIVGVSVLLSNIFAALGGSWWPIEIVPQTFRTVGMVSPSYWAMDVFHQVIFFNKGLQDIAFNFIILSIYIVVFLFLAARFFKIQK
jgi:ABC-2 type transport system permease protein